jgi:Fe-S-cluster containining protein
MVSFTCTRCGKCCQHFGPYVSIERELEEGHYYCRCSLNGQYFFARVTGDHKKDFIEKNLISGSLPPCPFLCREDEGTYACAIYPSRPAPCREFRCSSMDILDARGNRRGRVGGRKSLISTDPELIEFWRKEVQSLFEENDSLWREKTRRILEEKGYQVMLYE